MSKRKKKMTLKQMRSLVVFLVAINIILLLCILVMGFFLAKAQITKGKGQTVMLQKAVLCRIVQKRLQDILQAAFFFRLFRLLIFGKAQKS